MPSWRLAPIEAGCDMHDNREHGITNSPDHPHVEAPIYVMSCSFQQICQQDNHHVYARFQSTSTALDDCEPQLSGTIWNYPVLSVYRLVPTSRAWLRRSNLFENDITNFKRSDQHSWRSVCQQPHRCAGSHMASLLLYSRLYDGRASCILGFSFSEVTLGFHTCSDLFFAIFCKSRTAKITN